MFQKWSIRIKLIILISLLIGGGIAMMGVLVSWELDVFQANNVRNRLAQEEQVLLNSIDQQKQSILVATQFLALSPNLQRLEGTPLSNEIGRLRILYDLDYVQLYNEDRNPTILPKSVEVTQLDQLLGLARMNMETTRLVETGDGRLLIAASVPVRQSDGRIFASLVAGRFVTEERLQEVNLQREDPILFVINDEGETIAQTAVSPIPLGTVEQYTETELIINKDASYLFIPLTIEQSTQYMYVIQLFDEAYQEFEAQSTGNSIRGIGAIGVVTFLMLILVLRQIVVQPLFSLTQAVSSIKEGDEIRVLPASQNQDEIGQLSRAFMTLLHRLQTVLNGLEERVLERTADLAKRDQELRDLVDTLEEQVEARTTRLKDVAVISERLSAILDIEQLLQALVVQVKERFGYYHVQVYLVDESEQKLDLKFGYGQAGLLMKERKHALPIQTKMSLVAQAAQTQEVVYVADVHQEQGWLANDLLADTRSEIAIPIMAGDKLMGILDVQSDQVNGLDEADAGLLQSVVNQVGVAITNAQLFSQVEMAKELAEQSKESAEAERSYAEAARQEAEVAKSQVEEQMWQASGQAQLSSAMSGVQDIKTLANNVTRQLCEYLDVQTAVLYLRDNATLVLSGGYACDTNKLPATFELGEGVVGQAAVKKASIILSDIPQKSMTLTSALGEITLAHLLLSPFLYEDEVVGVLEFGSFKAFELTQQKFIAESMGKIAIAFNTAQTRAQIDELLSRTQNQAEELAVQSEELRVANEELSNQTQNLRASQIALRDKQELLEQTNAQLEEKASALQENEHLLRQQQAELAEKAKALALASKYKSEFLANMSHELRTPLNSLLLLSGMLKNNSEENLTKDQIKSLNIIHKGGHDLLELINEILDLSKIEAGKMHFHLDTVSLFELQNTLKMQFEHVAADKELEFVVTLDESLPKTIRTDDQRLRQVVKNFLSNALKFTSKGGVFVDIVAPEQLPESFPVDLPASEAILIRVRDTGIGMTSDQLKVIFEAFQQADGSTSRTYGGTGLGLSISRELVKRLGGIITVTSTPNIGSTFDLYLPRHLAQILEDESIVTEPLLSNDPSPHPAGVSTQVPVTKKAVMPVQPDDRNDITGDDDRILLIIEDDKEFALIVRELARKKGFKCLLAPTGEEGLTLAQAYKPHGIVLDLNLPSISGWQVLDTLKINPDLRHIPVHIMSSEDSQLSAYQKGAIGFLTKPVNAEGLKEALVQIEHFHVHANRVLLVVEDNADARQTVVKLLSDDHLTILEAASGAEALQHLQSQTIDCIILDLSLPDMSGLEVLKRIQEHEKIFPCPVIIYTGRELTEAESIEISEYANRIIVKGVRSMERLLDETSLFLHQTVADLPASKRKAIQRLYREDEIFEGKRVLLVDDDMRNTFALSRVLREKGLQVKIASDGQKAIDILADDAKFDVILMDVMMPVMDGYETIEYLRKQPQFRTLPIISLTAKAMKEDREKCLAAGANDYLPKPIDIGRLFNLLRVWLYST